MIDPAVLSALLTRLGQGDPEAWPDFLREFAPVLLQVAQQIERDADAAGDTFLFIWPESASPVRLVAGPERLEPPSYDLQALGDRLLSYPWQPVELNVEDSSSAEDPWWSGWIRPMTLGIAGICLLWSGEGSGHSAPSFPAALFLSWSRRSRNRSGNSSFKVAV